MKEIACSYGVPVPFTVERNYNGVSCYPNETMEPAMDRYTCQRCGASFTHTMDGTCFLGNPPEKQLHEMFVRHLELCRLVTAGEDK